MKLGFLSAALLTVVAAPAMADSWMPSLPSKSDVYASVKGGWTQEQNQKLTNAGTKFDDGYIGTAAVGVNLGHNLRTELEGLYSKSDVDSVNSAKTGGNSEFMGAMVNGYYDFKNSSFFTPYVGAGIGYGQVSFNHYSNASTFIDGSDNVMAYQGIAGVSYEFNPCWSFTGEYRYIGTTDADARTAGGITSNASYQSHSLLAGVKYSF